MKCKVCGAEYIINKNLPSSIPEYLREKMKYVPSCDCYKKKMEEDMKRAIRQQERESKMNRVKKYRDISILDKKLDKSRFENADMTGRHIKFAKKFAEKFIELGTAPMGILFTGDVGTGKTYASACIANHLMRRGKTVLMMQLGLYLNKLKKEWEEAETDVLNYVETCDLLVIDDFGTEKVTGFVQEKTFNIIDKRYRAEKPIIITTNLSKEQIKEKFGDRISDRLEEMTFYFQVIGKSKRKNLKEQEFKKFIEG